MNSLSSDDVVVSGGASGVDSFAEALARGKGLQTVVFPALWGTYGKRAGAIRNRQIVEASDRIVAFWDGKSKGTKISIDIAKELKKPCEIVLCA